MDNDPAIIYRELGRIDQQDDPDREARLRAAVRAYEDARIDGLCHEGAWELALEAIRGRTTGSFGSVNDLARTDRGGSWID